MHKKKIIIFLLFVLVGTLGIIGFSARAHAAIGVVQAKSATKNAGPLTVNLTLTAGNLLYLVVGMNGNGSGCGIITVSDNASNVYTPATGYISQGFNCARSYYSNNINGGNVTITFMPSPNISIGYALYEISGLATSTPLDVVATTTCAASPCTSPAFTTTNADDIVLVGGVNYYTGTWNAGAIDGVTSTIATNGSTDATSGNMPTGIEYRILNSTVVGATGKILKVGSIYMNLFMAAFKMAASPVDVTAPTVPSGLAASTISTSQIDLSWSASTDIDDNASVLLYGIYRNGVRVATTTAGTISYSDTSLTASTTYTYTISAQDPAGNASAQSSGVNGSTSGISGAVIGALDSTTLDPGITNGVQLNSILWHGSLPGGTAIGFQFATSSSSGGPWNYIGPDGTISTFFTAQPATPIALPYSFMGIRYFRFRITLTSDSSQTLTPRVDDVNINWSP